MIKARDLVPGDLVEVSGKKLITVVLINNFLSW